MNCFTFALIKSHVKSFEYPKIIDFIEQSRFTVVSRHVSVLSEEKIIQFYAEHIGKPYWNNLVQSVSGPIVKLIIYSNYYDDVIASFRELLGPTNSSEAGAGTIRGNFGDKTSGIIANNAMHASDSLKSFYREMALFFGYSKA